MNWASPLWDLDDIRVFVFRPNVGVGVGGLGKFPAIKVEHSSGLSVTATVVRVCPEACEALKKCLEGEVRRWKEGA